MKLYLIPKSERTVALHLNNDDFWVFKQSNTLKKKKILMHTIFQFWKLLIFKLKIKCIHCIDHYLNLIKDDFKAHVFWLLKKQSNYSPSVMGWGFFCLGVWVWSLPHYLSKSWFMFLSCTVFTEINLCLKWNTYQLWSLL